MAVITISRQLGSGGEEVAFQVAKETGFILVDRKLLEGLIQEQGLSEADLDEIDEEATWLADRPPTDRQVYVDLLETLILDLASKGDLVVMGRGSQFIFRGFPGALHIQVIASPGVRVRRVMKRRGVDEATALRLIEESDVGRSEYIRHHYGEDWREPSHYDLVIRTDVLPPEVAARLVVQAAEEIALRTMGGDILQWLEQARLKVGEGRPVSLPAFAHPSEEELARVLDFYRIRWEYEPTSFPLAWDEEGKVVEAFTPDFYLPDFDLYIELTTLKQDLVTEKNRKIRRLRELHPEVKLKVFYGRDYQSLLQKYGLREKKNGPK
jgi:cytidylate kinase